MNVRVKICGLTRREDAVVSIDAGADALGFMFAAASPRCLTVSVAAEIARGMPLFVSRVGVFVNPEASAVRMAIELCGLDTIQFHGEETPEFCAQFPVRVIKAFPMRDEKSLLPLSKYPVDAWLLDSCVPGKRGGTGARFNWDLARQAKALGRPVLLAGGLDPENVAEAIRKVRPYAVDVSSGVESAPGLKDARKVAEFIAAAKRAGNA